MSKKVRKDGIKQRDDGKWDLIFYPIGKAGPCINRVRKTKVECIELKREIMAQYATGKDWKAAGRRDMRKLQDLIDEWWKAKGPELRYGVGRKQKLDNLCTGLGNPVASALTTEMITNYRSKRLDENIKPNTVNREINYLRAVFKYLTKSGSWKGKDPVTPVSDIKVQQGTLTYLTKEEIARLLHACEDSKNRHLYLVVLICLSTGARWSEAEGLKRDDIKNNTIQFGNTKSGKRRAIKINDGLFKMIRGHQPESKNALFGGCVEAFENALERAHIDIPKGQLTHVLRHSFAVHFMMNRGNIVTLQRCLGHSTIVTTQIYLQYSPDHMEEIAELNPVNTYNFLKC